MTSVDLPTFNVLSLAAGAGGLDLGIRMAIPNARTVCFVEIEAYACEILASRMEEGRLDPAPVWTDLRTFDGRAWRGAVDLVAAGYPCQPFSCAGKQRGKDDPRHLWPHVKRTFLESGAEWLLIENVANHVNIGFDEVVSELQGLGCHVEAGLYEACEAGAPHHRRRLFALAHTAGKPQREPHDATGTVARQRPRQDAGRGGLRMGGTLGHPDDARLEGRRGHPGLGADEQPAWPPGPSDEVGWKRYLKRRPGLEPAVHRGADGMADRLDRLRLCGNGVVPAQAALAIETLMERILADGSQA